MEYTRDVVAEWPNFADHRVRGTSALFIGDAEVEGGAWQIVGAGAVGTDRFLAVVLEGADDTRRARLTSFSMRYPHVVARYETHEQLHGEAGDSPAWCCWGSPVSWTSRTSSLSVPGPVRGHRGR